jgi:hypothetical protein
MFGKHGSSIGIDRTMPAFGKEAAAVRIKVTTRSDGAIFVCRNSPGMGAGFFAEGIVLQEAGDTA